MGEEAVKTMAPRREPVYENGTMLTTPAAFALFSLMQGRWHAHGERVFLVAGEPAGKRVAIEAWVDSVRQGEFLVSRNRIEERDPLAAAPRAYVRDYWIRASASPEIYEFGAGPLDSAGPVSQGRFDGVFLSLEQNLGGQPPFRVVSRSEFRDPDTTVYVEVFWQGDKAISETRLEYKRGF